MSGLCRLGSRVRGVIEMRLEQRRMEVKQFIFCRKVSIFGGRGEGDWRSRRLRAHGPEVSYRNSMAETTILFLFIHIFML